MGILNRSLGGGTDASNAESMGSLSMDENVKPSKPFNPGLDSTNTRKNFAQKKFNEKQRSFASRSRRELPKELLM